MDSVKGDVIFKKKKAAVNFFDMYHRLETFVLSAL